MIFDTHAHYDDSEFDADREDLLSGMKKEGIRYIVNVGADLESTKRSIELSEKYDFVYATAGVHPSETGKLDEKGILWLKEQCKRKKTVAVGEIGLDYYWDEPEKEIQKEWFACQIVMAKEVSLPLVIHSREAAKDTIDIMKAQRAEESGGIIHCFSYTKETAKTFLNMGFSFGIGGVITFKNAVKLREAVEYIPMDRIVIETDCPYLSPEPNRGKRNTSFNLLYVIKRIAEIKGLNDEEVMRITFENAKKIYRIQDEIKN